MTTLTYDPLGNISTVERGDRLFTVQNDEDGVLPELVTNSLGQPTTLRVDRRFGSLKTRVDPNGIPEQWAYDGFGRMVHAKGPEGETHVDVAPASSCLFCALEVTVEGDDGRRARYGILPRGQVAYVETLGLGGAVVLENFYCDALARLVRSYRPHLAGDTSQGSISYDYDALDRLIQVTNADGSTRQYEYASAPALGNFYTPLIPGSTDPTEVVRITDELGHHSVSVLDRYGNTVRSVDAANVDKLTPNTTDLTYGPFQTLTAIRDNLGNVMGMEYDTYGRRTAVVDPDTGRWTYGYTPYDELSWSEDPTQQQVTFWYDALGRLTHRVSSEGTTSWTYDGPGPNEIGRLVQAVAPPSTANPSGHSVRYAYEPPSATMNRGLLESVTHDIDNGGSPLTTRAEYDAAGRLTTVHYPAPDGIDVTVDYVHDGPYVSAVRHVEPGAITTLWRIDQADQGYRIAQETHPTSDAATTYTYEPTTGQLSRKRTEAGNIGVVQDIRYTYWPNGAVLQRALDQAGETTEFDAYYYDERNRLQRVNAEEHEYDEIGNITSKPGMGTYVYNPSRPHLPVAAGEHTYNHDARGNMTRRAGPTVPFGGQDIHYTSFDLPSQIDVGSPTVSSTYFEYDATQARVLKQTDFDRTLYAGDLYREIIPDNITQPSEHRYLVYVGDRQVAEMVRTEGESRPHVRYALYTDRLGTVTTVSDRQTAWARDIDVYGRWTWQSVGDPGVEAGFTGHRHDPELGLVDMGGRVYDPSAGRFLSADPIMEAPASSQGSNRYSYVFNNPTNLTDPTGFQSFNDVMSTGVKWFVTLGHLGTAVAATGGFGLGDPGVAGALGVRGLFSSSSGGRTITPNTQVAGAGPVSGGPAATSGYDAVGQNQGFGAGEPATCGGPGEPRCDKRRFGSSPMDRIVVDFINRRSEDVAWGTIGESLLDPSAPEHAAPIIRTAQGKLRLGKVTTSKPGDHKFVTVQIPTLENKTLKPGEEFVGIIHGHPGPRQGVLLAQSKTPDLPGARTLADSHPTFRSSYVVGPSGKGPYYGVIEFTPRPAPGSLIDLTP